MIPFLDAHHLVAVNVRIGTMTRFRHVNLLLLLYLFALLYLLAFLRFRHVLCRIDGGLVDAVAITEAVAIMVGLPTLHLGAFACMGLIAALPRVSGRTGSEVEGDESVDVPRPSGAARQFAARPWLIAAVVLLDLLLLFAVLYLGWRVLHVF